MTTPSRPTRRLSRRSMLTHALASSASVLLAACVSACRQKIVEVERVVQVEKEVTKIVTEIVKETVVIEHTRVETRIVQAEPPTPTPSPEIPHLEILGLATPWTRHLVAMQEAFQELFGVAIRWRPLVDWADYQRYVDVALAADDLPDLMETPSGAVPARWRLKGVTQDMDDLIQADQLSTEGILPAALTAFRFRDATLAIPYLAHGGHHLLGYDLNHLQELGIATPKPDWPITRLATLKGPAPGTRGFATLPSLPEVYPLLPLFGVQLYDAAGEFVVAPHRLRVLISWLMRMDAYGTGDQASRLMAPIEMLEQGHLLATCVSLAEARHWLWQTTMEPPRFEAALFPLMPGQPSRAASIQAIGFCLSATTRAADIATHWLKYVSSSEMGVSLFTLGLAAPGCRAASWSDPRVTDILPLCAQIAKELQTASAPSLPASLDIESVIDSWNNAMRKTLDGQWTVEQCVDELRSELALIANEPR